jgi:hypothetical protein
MSPLVPLPKHPQPIVLSQVLHSMPHNAKLKQWKCMTYFSTFSFYGAFSCLLKGGRLRIGRLKLGYKGFFLRLGNILISTFVVHTSPNNYSTFGPHLLKYALLLEAPSSSSHLGPHCLRQSLTLWWIEEYDCVTKAFTPLPQPWLF